MNEPTVASPQANRSFTSVDVDELTHLVNNYNELQSACLTVWPAVRQMATFSSNPEFIANATKFGVLIKAIQSDVPTELTADMLTEIRCDTIDQVTDWIERLWIKRFDPRGRESFLKALSELKDQERQKAASLDKPQQTV